MLIRARHIEEEMVSSWLEQGTGWIPGQLGSLASVPLVLQGIRDIT